jgi:hypothetical protein
MPSRVNGSNYRRAATSNISLSRFLVMLYGWRVKEAPRPRPKAQSLAARETSLGEAYARLFEDDRLHR